MVKTGNFEFDIDLLISLVDARPVLRGKTDDICKDRDEKKKAWRVSVYLSSRRFRSSRRCQKIAFGEYCHNLLNTAD